MAVDAEPDVRLVARVGGSETRQWSTRELPPGLEAAMRNTSVWSIWLLRCASVSWCLCTMIPPLH